MGYWICQKCSKKISENLPECPYCRDNKMIIHADSGTVDAASIKCPSCKLSIPKAATTCPYCRKAIRTKPMAAIIAGGVLALTLLAMCSTHNTAPPGPNKYDAKDSSERYIKSMLKAPSSAQFPGMSEWLIVEDAKEFSVQSFVDSQNSFGAMMRMHFKCTVSKPGLLTFCEMY